MKVNSKIQAVIDELKTQKQALEQKLKTVETDIEQRVEAASVCKKNVEEANNTISNLENDIEKLKTDLQELHDKFDSAGFTELLEAGNKEINGKIIEDNTKISEQQALIKQYSEEAQSIKDELTALKDSKINLESELNNTIVALKYYSKRIDEMTITAIEHAEKLSDIVVVDDDSNDNVDVDVNKVIDGTIFDEIDKISSTDRELSEEELEDILNTKAFEEEIRKQQEEAKEEELSKTQALDAAIIETANISDSIVDNEETTEPMETTNVVEQPVETTIPTEVTAVEEIPIEEPVEVTQEEDLEKTQVFDEPVQQVGEESIEQTPAFDEPVQQKEEEEIEVLVPLKEDYETIPVESTPVEVPSEPVTEIQTNEINTLSPIEETTIQTSTNDGVLEEQEIITDTVEAPTEVIPVTAEETIDVIVPTKDNVGDNKVRELGLDISRFDEISLNIVNANLDVENGKRIIDVLENHFIDTNNIYNSPTILVTMEPDALDEELSLLEHAGCMATTLNYIFKYLDKIDISKLREKVTGPTDSIIKVLYDCITERQTVNISEVLELTPEATSTLEANLDAKEYNIMCAFPEVIKANYDTIKNLHVDDPVKCITEHPKRFMNNPDIFDDILDKYDTPDLVRCINKNPAVIDKL